MAEDFQTKVAKALLGTLRHLDFALAGGRGLKELGVVDRPTEDLDIFIGRFDQELFEKGLDEALETLTSLGCRVEVLRRTPSFARFLVSRDNDATAVDFAFDYREKTPLSTPIGPVVSAEDAVLNKVSALYTRCIARDYIDLHYIRKANIMDDNEIIEKSMRRDAGFIPSYFAQALQFIDNIPYADFESYDVTPEEHEQIVASTKSWVLTIQSKY
jgi:hypothetical protein